MKTLQRVAVIQIFGTGANSFRARHRGRRESIFQVRNTGDTLSVGASVGRSLLHDLGDEVGEEWESVVRADALPCAIWNESQRRVARLWTTTISGVKGESSGVDTTCASRFWPGDPTGCSCVRSGRTSKSINLTWSAIAERAREHPLIGGETTAVQRITILPARAVRGSAGNHPADCANCAEYEELDSVAGADPGCCAARHGGWSQPRDSARCGGLFGQPGRSSPSSMDRRSSNKTRGSRARFTAARKLSGVGRARRRRGWLVEPR